jgi:hypothetical protein
VLATLALVGLCASAQASAQAVNSVREIRAAEGGATVEIEVESSKEFPVGGQIVVLRIGKDEFIYSKTPPGGSLNRLIFLVPAKAFAAIPDGTAMTVQYGRGEHGHDRRTFGPLDKGQLKGELR